jgi:Kef-type K+ transport system membrane component KefB/nucleotide-binding universal stress UspA family protein
MVLLFEFALPLKDPILVFSIVLFIILLAPTLLGKFKIPSIIGLILSGLVLGPNGFNVLERSESIVLFGTVGLLYIMFLAALEIDLHDFKKNKNKSIAFGALTFFIPMILGTLSSYFILGFGMASSILLASMFASHTLLAYPMVSKLGITKNRAVNITIGGTMITDTAALLVLAIIAGASQGDLNQEFWLRLGVSIIIFIGLVLYGVPFISRWFFKSIEDSVLQYIFVLGMVFLSAFLAELAGMEAIIGAFMGGLALNRLIPHSSQLMNRIEFVGNALFIPFFLISVGMLVDIRIFFQGYEALFVAVVMIIVATGSKWLAAFFTQRMYGFSISERNIIFGLSNAQAAATLAAVLVGYKLEILNENVLNGTILMILATCLIASFYAEKAAKEIAIQEAGSVPDVNLAMERILVPISYPQTIDRLIELALMIRNPKSMEPVYSLAVVNDDAEAKEKIALSNQMMEKAVKYASATDTRVEVVTRIDLNPSNGIIRAAKELLATDIIIGWSAQLRPQDFLFGSTLDNLLKKTDQTLMVYKIAQPLNTIKNIVAILPLRTEFEFGFSHTLSLIKRITKETGAELEMIIDPESRSSVDQLMPNTKPEVNFNIEEFGEWEDFLVLARKVSEDDLLVVVSARPHNISHKKIADIIPKYVSKYFQKNNVLIIFPEQGKTGVGA